MSADYQFMAPGNTCCEYCGKRIGNDESTVVNRVLVHMRCADAAMREWPREEDD